MDDIPSDSPAHRPISAQRARMRFPWMRVALTVVLIAAALIVLLGHEDPAIFGTARDRLFPVVSSSPTPTNILTQAAQTPSATPDPLPILQQRPLHISALAAGESCVTTPGKQVNPEMGPALGEGPVYMVGYGAEGTNTIYMSRVDGGWYYLKTIWTAPPNFHGAFLLRGGQVDGPNAVRFSEDTTGMPDLQVVYSSGNAGSTQSGWLPWINYVRIRAPGCYGIQVDGLNFSEVIRFRILDTPYDPKI